MEQASFHSWSHPGIFIFASIYFCLIIYSLPSSHPFIFADQFGHKLLGSAAYNSGSAAWVLLYRSHNSRALFMCMILQYIQHCASQRSQSGHDIPPVAYLCANLFRLHNADMFAFLSEALQLMACCHLFPRSYYVTFIFDVHFAESQYINSPPLAAGNVSSSVTGAFSSPAWAFDSPAWASLSSFAAGSPPNLNSAPVAL